jgi:hypothetical protein
VEEISSAQPFALANVSVKKVIFHVCAMQRQKSRAHAGIKTIQSGISSVTLLFSNVNREGGNAGNRG